jgi:methylmalonyl-CoA mutase cobalamin-binding domain/chain
MSLNEQLSQAVIDGDSELTIELANQVIEQDLDLNDAIINGLNNGMKIVSKLYEQKEYFLPEIIISADALYDALEVFKPHLEKKESTQKAIVVIGVVRGDIHDIGKNITKLFIEASGYKVIDCGRNVTVETFMDAIKENNANILALSTLMSPTLESIEELISKLKEEGLRDKLKVIIGGAATSEQFADSIGVMHCNNAAKAVSILDELYSGGNG